MGSENSLEACSLIASLGAHAQCPAASTATIFLMCDPFRENPRGVRNGSRINRVKAVANVSHCQVGSRAPTHIDNPSPRSSLGGENTINGERAAFAPRGPWRACCYSAEQLGARPVTPNCNLAQA